MKYKNRNRLQVFILGQIVLNIFMFCSSSFVENNKINEGISLRGLDPNLVGS